MGWVDFDLDAPPICPAAQLTQPYSNLPKQNQADRGMTKIKVNPTQVRDHQSHPIQVDGPLCKYLTKLIKL